MADNFLGLLRGRIYRVVMKLAHRYHWHYAPPVYPDGDTMLWCKWCGMRDVIKRRGAPSISTASPARTYQWPDTELDLRESGQDCGEITPVSLANYDRDTCSWRTSQRCFLEGWERFSETWPKSGMTRSGAAFKLPTLASRITAIGCGFWPTPLRADEQRCLLKLHSLAKRAHGKTGNDFNFAEHVAAELGGYPTKWFALSLMGYPITWTDLLPQETPSSPKSRRPVSTRSKRARNAA